MMTVEDRVGSGIPTSKYDFQGTPEANVERHAEVCCCNMREWQQSRQPARKSMDENDDDGCGQEARASSMNDIRSTQSIRSSNHALYKLPALFGQHQHELLAAWKKEMLDL